MCGAIPRFAVSTSGNSGIAKPVYGAAITQRGSVVFGLIVFLLHYKLT
jgi:hypothetical protein